MTQEITNRNETETDFIPGNSDQVIQGEIIKYVDGRGWTTKEGNALAENLELIALSTRQVLQRWGQQMPVETVFAVPGETLPDVDDLNAKIPEEEWEVGLNGERKPPWVRQYIVYLLNPRDAACFTYINGTAGARVATESLSSKVVRMRQLQGARVLPVVTLGSAPMKTKFGVKRRPEFVVTDWRGFSPSAIPAGPAPKAITREKIIDDQIPF
jgi:hypothetical protein